MKSKFVISLCAFGLFGALSACGSTGLLDRNRPDEFAVTRATPLTIPSEFTLPTPQPDAPRPQASDSKTEVLDAMFGGTAPAPR
jgi:Protein of unknown function (DUF3035)